MADTLTDLFVKNMKPESKEYTRREKGGFGVRVYPTGRKTFFYMYRVDGDRRFLNLGEYYEPSRKGEAKGARLTLQEARDLYDSERAKVKDLKNGRAAGPDPVELRRQKSEQRKLARVERKRTPTVAKFIEEEYLEKYAKKKKRSWRTDEKILQKDILPLWGPLKITDIKRRDIHPILDDMINRGAPIQANRLLACVRKVFSYAVTRDIIEINPFLRMKLPSEENKRERALSEDEIKTFWGNLAVTDILPEMQRALKLILVTSQRPGEVIGMHSREIDGHWWTIPKERAKNKRTHRVYLTDLALELIGDAKGYIFESSKKPGQPFDSLVATKGLKRNFTIPVTDEKGKPLFTADGKPAVKNLLGVEPFTPHDLRRTAATLMAKEKVLKEHRERVLNHALEKLDAVYNQHDYDDAKQAALETLSGKLQHIITGNQGKVLSIKQGRKAK